MSYKNVVSITLFIDLNVVHNISLKTYISLKSKTHPVQYYVEEMSTKDGNCCDIGKCIL